MERDFPITDATVAAYPNSQIEQRVSDAKKAILNTTSRPIQLTKHNVLLQTHGFRDADIRVGVLDLLGSGELILNQDRTIVRTMDYQLSLGFEQEIISSEA
ncbi:MAG: hypothetical protein Q7T54_00020 [Candidatus Levybacteria bacterium]|nr:hypothetical protein [Candidatus Levybacteria bacterium]